MTPDRAAVASFVAEVGRRVARLRVHRGWTQARLARAAGIPAGTLGRIERGQAETTVTRLRDIATALGVPLVDLLPDAGLLRPVPGQSSPACSTCPDQARAHARVTPDCASGAVCVRSAIGESWKHSRRR